MEEGRGGISSVHTHLSLGGSDGGPAWVDLLIDTGQEVLGDSERVLQQSEVRVLFRSVFQQILNSHKTSVI